MHALDTLNVEYREGTTAIRRCQRHADVSHGVLQWDVAVGNVQDVAIVGLQIRHQQITAPTRLADLLMAGKCANASDAGHAHQREAVFDGPRREDAAADADDCAHCAQRGR